LQTYDRGRRYTATDGIDATIAGADVDAGVMNVYCMYSYAPGQALADTGGSSNT